MDHRRADFEARVTVIPLLSHVGAISALRPQPPFHRKAALLKRISRCPARSAALGGLLPVCFFQCPG